MKKLIFLIGILAVSLAASIFFDAGPTSAHMTCGNGMTFNPAHTPTNGQPACIPANDWSSSAPSTSRGRWETRSGSFASDTKSGAIGVATGLGSKSKAEKAAIAHCRVKGGVDCRPFLSYHNQCAAVAWGDGTLQASSAARSEEAEQRALALCAPASKSCTIFFSACSYAEFVE